MKIGGDSQHYRTRKVMDVLPPCHKVTYEPGTVVEGPQDVLPIV